MDPKSEYRLPSIGCGLGAEEGCGGEIIYLVYKVDQPPVVYENHVHLDPVVQAAIILLSGSICSVADLMNGFYMFCWIHGLYSWRRLYSYPASRFPQGKEASQWF